MNQTAIIATLLSIVLSVIAFSTIVCCSEPTNTLLYKIINRTPKLTAKKVRKRQKKVLSEVIKEWNNDILQAANEGKSGVHIKYYDKNYSETALKNTVEYFRLWGFDVDYTPSSAYISWNKENE